MEKLIDLKNEEGNYVLGNTIYSKDGEPLGLLDGFENEAEEDLEEVKMKEAEELNK